MEARSCVKHERRSANYYKPNIWSYEFVQSLTTEFKETSCRRQAEKLRGEFKHCFSQVSDLTKRLHVVDNITKLGLSYLLNEEIKDVLDTLASNLNNLSTSFKDDIFATALSFRLLRQHGYHVSQDIFVHLIDKMEETSIGFELKGVLEVFEASHLAVTGEEVIVEAKALAYKSLAGSCRWDMDANIVKQVDRAMEVPCHWRVTWFDIKHHLHAYELEDDKNLILLELAKLNFNIFQALHVEDLKEMSRWWRDLGVIEKMEFSRDRLVESFLWTVGVACEPQHALLRKCLTKMVSFVLLIDDMYDIFGSLEELEGFTRAVDRWDYEELQQLPECMKICFQALNTTINEISKDIEKDKGWKDILAYLKMAWADFCKALLQEAWWSNQNCVPSLEDYMRSAWITSSGPLISLITLLCSANGESMELKDKWEKSQDLVYHTSSIIRLCNDLGTSDAELERREVSSSILCYMEQANVREEKARMHLKEMISSDWSKVNKELISHGGSLEHQMFANLVVNAARVCHFIYRNGDGFSVQDQDTIKQIKGLLIEPCELDLIERF